MAIVEIGSKVYNVPDQVASKLLDTSNKIEELEMEVRKLKKDVLDEEIHWHSQKQKRMSEKRKKLKYKQIINETIEYIENNKEGTDCCGDTYIGLGEIEIEELLKILKGK